MTSTSGGLMVYSGSEAMLISVGTLVMVASSGPDLHPSQARKTTQVIQAATTERLSRTRHAPDIGCLLAPGGRASAFRAGESVDPLPIIGISATFGLIVKS